MGLNKRLLALLILLGVQFQAKSEIYRYEIRVPNANTTFSQSLWLDYRPECQVEVDQALKEMSGYLYSVAAGSKRKARLSLEKIRVADKKTQSSNCYESIFEITTMSAAISLHGGINQADHEMMNHFLVYIQRKHIIKPLTAEVRKKHSILQNEKVMGAYYCPEDLIWLDPEASPYNRASILMHELVHWAVAHAKTGGNSDLSHKSAYLYEEFISALNPALTQVSLKSNANRVEDGQVKKHTKVYFDGSSFGWTNPKTHFKTERDLNLYSPHGVLSKSWTKIIKEKGIKREDGYRDFLMNDFFDVELKKKPSALVILQMIEEAYFGKVTSDSESMYQYLKANREFLKKSTNPLDAIVYTGSKAWGPTGPKRWDSIGKPFCEAGTTPYPGPGGEGGSMSLDAKLMNSNIRACLTPHKDF